MGTVLSSLMDEPPVKTISSLEKWQKHFNKIKNSSKLVVVEFTAAWCGPCKAMAPVFNKMAKEFTEDEFIRIDVDELSEVGKEYQVEAIPAFLLFKKGKLVERIVGANKEDLREKVNKHKTTSN